MYHFNTDNHSYLVEKFGILATPSLLLLLSASAFFLQKVLENKIFFLVVDHTNKS